MHGRAALFLTALLTLAAIVLSFTSAPPLAVFGVAALAILGLAALLGGATEELGAHLGHRVGGILNATVGNVGEIIIAVFALKAGLIDLVKASITGSIIGNVLLVFGASVTVGGLKHGIQRFDARSAGMNAVQLLLATIGLVVPATFAFLVGGEQVAQNFLPIESVTIGVAVLLMALYGLSVFYDLTRPPGAVRSGDEMHTPDAQGAAAQRHWSRPLALLVVSAGALAWVSEILVGAVEPVVHQLGVSQFFLGIVVIPIIGNLAEHLVALQLARKNQMDFAIAVSLGSATQVALFAAPLLVFLSIPLGHPLTLVFTPFEVIAVAASALIAALIAIDGESNWLEGAQLVAVYLMLAVAFFFLPIGLGAVHP
ncbi:MAG: calcium/proton exchanger [Candidatus Eisenbacteria bacterium]